MFSANYMLTYFAEKMISSGLVAVTFTLLLYFNILGARFLYKIPITKNSVIGALVGGIGVVLIFAPEIMNFVPGSHSIWGLTLGALGTLFASAGNLVSYKHRETGVPIMVSNAFGMFYGSLFTLIIALVLQESFETQWTEKYITSLIYLSVFGSVIAFGAYLTLIARIGAEKNAYTSIINPIIALVLSSLFEDFHWSTAVFFGIALCLLGNILTLHKKRTAVRSSFK